jgi:hypothetical protein
MRVGALEETVTVQPNNPAWDTRECRADSMVFTNESEGQRPTAV